MGSELARPRQTLLRRLPNERLDPGCIMDTASLLWRGAKPALRCAKRQPPTAEPAIAFSPGTNPKYGCCCPIFPGGKDFGSPIGRASPANRFCRCCATRHNATSARQPNALNPEGCGTTCDQEQPPDLCRAATCTGSTSGVSRDQIERASDFQWKHHGSRWE